jgi:hypothetical protein
LRPPGPSGPRRFGGAVGCAPMTTIILSVDPGLILRPWRDEDLPSLLAAHRDPAMKRWLASRIEDPEQGRAWLAAQEAGWADGTRCSFAVVEAGNPSPIGHVVAKRLRPGAASAEIGYWVSVEARGGGLHPARSPPSPSGRCGGSPVSSCCTMWATMRPVAWRRRQGSRWSTSCHPTRPGTRTRRTCTSVRPRFDGAGTSA